MHIRLNDLSRYKDKSNNYHFLFVGLLINILVLLFNILTGSKDTVSWKSDVSFLFEYILKIEDCSLPLYYYGIFYFM